MDKMINVRIQNKHDSATNWELHSSFIPKAGEMIIYDGPVPNIKIGDGTSTIANLNFIDHNHYTKSEVDTLISQSGGSVTIVPALDSGTLIATINGVSIYAPAYTDAEEEQY
jgi:hypothetical protein